MHNKLEQYLLNHSSAEDPVLEDLYRQTHIRFVNPNMCSGHLQGKFLEFISKMLSPQHILEIGTFTGYSSICLARGLKEDGKLITLEINDELSTFAHQYFKLAGAEKKIEQIIGNAIDIIPCLKVSFDLIFIDGDKREYIEYFKVSFDKLRPGGFIIVDNVLWGGKIFENNITDSQARGISDFNNYISELSDIEKIILPLRDGLMLIRKP